jgi:hypothetical protein
MIVYFKGPVVIGALLVIILAGEVFDTTIEEGIHAKLSSQQSNSDVSNQPFVECGGTIMINGLNAMSMLGLNGGLASLR